MKHVTNILCAAALASVSTLAAAAGTGKTNTGAKPSGDKAASSGNQAAEYICQEKVTSAKAGDQNTPPKRFQYTTETECIKGGGEWVPNADQQNAAGKQGSPSGRTTDQGMSEQQSTTGGTK